MFKIPTLSPREQENVDKLATLEGVPLPTLIRTLLLQRLKDYKAGKISEANVRAAVHGRKPGRKDRPSDAARNGPARSSTKSTLPGRLVPARRNRASSARASSEESAVQHSLPMGG